MARTMIDANTAIFRSLDDVVSGLGGAIPNSGSPRWIATSPNDRSFLKDSKVRDFVEIGLTRKVLHIEYQSCSYFFTVGFSEKNKAANFEEIDLNSSQLTLVLFEGKVKPIRGSLEIIQNVGGQDRNSDLNYEGHSPDLIYPLYPAIRLFKSSGGVVADFWQAHFMLCLEEAMTTGAWLSEDLFNSLITMSELDAAKIPYAVLCRSIFDHDKASLFLALYRCLEALYSYSATASLVYNLGIKKDWKTVSKQLEIDLRWYPKEDTALQGLFKGVGLRDLRGISEALNIPTEPIDTLSTRTARAVYDIRNKSVHFRPFHQDENFELIDWDKLCIVLSCIVLDIYNEIG